MAQTSTAKPDVLKYDPAARAHEEVLMYFIVFAIVMLFAGFTSAYIVSNMGQYWVRDAHHAVLDQQRLVGAFLGRLVVGRAVMRGGIKSNPRRFGCTLLFGIGFTVSQAEGWQGMADLAWAGR